MYLSRNWLEQYIDLSGISSQEIADILTLRVAEVEEVRDVGASLEGIVVGKITEITDHPNADALRCCTVDVGSESVPVVCGGSNIVEGQLIAMGMVGAKVRWHGEGELIELKKAKIRGEVSLGMICAAEEIGLGEIFPKTDEKEILDLSHLDAAVGTPLAEALEMNDVIFDIDNKTLTHRPDLWGHYGMARELGALLDRPVKPYPTSAIPKGSGTTVTVTVEDKELCPRYMAVAMDGIEVTPSPAWMQQRIVAAGMRPINLIVDVTNYVMLELGQPMHAFDRAVVAGESGEVHMTVRHAQAEESFTTLNDKELILTSEMLVVDADGSAVALAGVKGDKKSGVTDKTTSIVLEAANFEAAAVRRAASTVGLRTDSSARFEKSLDPAMCSTALARAVSLILAECPGAQVSSRVADVAAPQPQSPVLVLAQSVLSSRLGYDLPLKEAGALLSRLGFGVKQKRDELRVTVPTWRATKDIAIKEDLVEEILRLVGYDEIPSSVPAFPTTPPPQVATRPLIRKVKEWLAHEFRYTEVYSYSFVSPEWLETLGIDTAHHLALDNPLAKDRPLIRRYLAPNMLEHVVHNADRYDDVRLFEVGRVFDQTQPGEQASPQGDERLPKQDVQLMVVRAQQGNETPFYNLVSVLDGLCDRLGVSHTVTPIDPDEDFSQLSHPGRLATITVDDMEVGSIGEVHPAMQQKLGLDRRVAMLQLNLTTLAPLVTHRIAYQPLPQFPVIERDIALLVDTGVAHTTLATAITDFHDLIVKTELFDVYEGEHVPEGKKSVAYRVTYRSDDRTLTTEEVEKIHTQLVDLLVTDIGATIR